MKKNYKLLSLFLFLFSTLTIAQGLSSVNSRSDISTPASQAQGLESLAIKPPVIVVTREVISVSDTARPPAGTMEEFLYLEKACKSRQALSCVEAGKIMMADRPPQEIFDMSSSKRAQRALRLYENAIDPGESLEAMELAYDIYYDKNIINRQFNSYTDKDRAKELLDAMLSKNYPGGQIRQARDYIESPEYALDLGKKKEACATVKNLIKQPNLTTSTRQNVEDLSKGNVCGILN